MCLTLGELLLSMDNHGAQQTPRFKEGLTDNGIRPAYTSVRSPRWYQDEKFNKRVL